MLFDAREPFDREDPNWTNARRAMHLLRLDVVRPLSVDALVWPCVITGTELPSWTGEFGLWEDLARLEQFVGLRPHQRIAVTRTAESIQGWSLLGSDVADGALISGLSNCGYRQDEMSTLRKFWASRLNGNHLFDAFDDASRFREMTDARVPEHAPFAVYGLWAPKSDLPFTLTQSIRS